MSAREFFDDARFERLQNRVLELEKKLAKIPFADGSLVEGQSIATAATAVNHRLGRTPRGVLVLRASPDSALGFSVTQPPNPSQAVNLEASAIATFTLWFW
jgi:hypothetical protein